MVKARVCATVSVPPRMMVMPSSTRRSSVFSEAGMVGSVRALMMTERERECGVGSCSCCLRF